MSFSYWFTWNNKIALPELYVLHWYALHATSPYSEVATAFLNCIVLFFVNLDFHDFLLYSFLIQSLTCTPPSPNLLLHHILNYTQYEIPFFLSLDPPKTKILSLMSENPFPGLRVCVCPDTKIEAFLSKQRGAIDGWGGRDDIEKQLLIFCVSVGFQTLEFGGHPRKLKDSKHH